MSYSLNPHLPRIRMEAVRLVKQDGWSTRKVARHYGFTHSAIVKWCKKDQTWGWRRIPTQSSRPHHHPRALSEEKIARIVTIRKQHGRSAEVVHKTLANQGVQMSLSSVKRTLDREGLLNKRSPWKRYHPPMPRPHVASTGDLVQVDTIHLVRRDGKRVYIFTLIDVYSRWVFARAYPRANTHSAVDFVRRAQQRASFTFTTIQSDHGSEFSQHFTERIAAQHRHSRVRMPNDNAHIERFNRTLQEECTDGVPKEVDALNRAITRYLPYYNNERLHFGLQLRTPMQMVPSY